MAEWIGFTVNNEDSLPVAKIQEIIGWCAGPKIILELDNTCDLNVVQSMLHVLPVNGLELSVSTWNKISDMDGIENLDLIFTEKPAFENNKVFCHAPQNPGSFQFIQMISEPKDFDLSLPNHPLALSLNCFPSDNPALKNYDNWMDFLEQLDMI
jgi:hypothetical protein